MPSAPDITAFFDEATNSVSYLVADPASGLAAVIDPVLDFDGASGRIGTGSADKLLAVAAAKGLTIAWVLETHAHADHLSAGSLIRERTGAKIGIGAGIREVQQAFAPMLAVDDLRPDDFDRRFEDGDTISVGELTIEVLMTPGHTPACVTYRVGDAAFVGDTLFMPDYGTARCDFPGGSARQLFRSLHRILALPRDTRLFTCHDYKAPGRDVFAWETTVGEQIDHNTHVGDGVEEEAYVAMREARDATLKAPKLLYPAIQVNIRGGRLPPADDQRRRYLVLPLTF
ncbi:MBL fold metallo-hydrolase [Sphingomonas sp. URHD0057]|uniref:MBL fold metallo-hydrolase n=1 Tax=Sphingomonas sp. URHD0057 TaxID=1380389 RepID=UPI00048AA649|nr:MBL fold metallo-hydrolase [Sphingomonas sp. URHD0057]